MNIAVVGSGYVGLVTGTCLAESGNQVICVDIDQKKIKRMKAGEVPIYEPQLDVYFKRNIKANRLSFTTDLKEAQQKSEIIFLALPTPPGEDGSADLSYVLKVAEDLAKMITSYKIVVDKSTVPVGTAEKVTQLMQSITKVPFDVVSNPEFLREGFAVADFMKPDRVVVGTDSERAREIMGALYAPFVRQGNPVIFMDAKSAELTKYAANAFLATKITFMNEIANYCELVGANVDMIRRGIGADDRIGKRFLFAGIGYGGSCFPKDVKALVNSGNETGFHFRILDSVMQINHKQRLILVDKLRRYFSSGLKNLRIAVWGLAFKPDTDDIREAPALEMIDQLLKEGAHVTAFDPEAMDNVKQLIGDKITLANSYYEALDGADALVIATEWQQFRSPNFDEIARRLKQKVIFDGRNLYEPQKVKAKGFYYESIGRN
jgi:UDPglucose 6-dehydrogenase